MQNIHIKLEIKYLNNLRLTDYIQRFKIYRDKNPTWGSLRDVLYDGNISDNHVIHSRGLAIANGDSEGVVLAEFLLEMNKAQRNRLPYLVEEL